MFTAPAKHFILAIIASFSTTTFAENITPDESLANAISRSRQTALAYAIKFCQR